MRRDGRSLARIAPYAYFGRKRPTPAVALIARLPTRHPTESRVSSRVLRLIAPMAVWTLIGCGAPSDSGEIVREVRSDTTFVVVPDIPLPDDEALVEVLWASDSLERPNLIAIRGDLLVVGDRTRLHLFDLGSGTVESIGREGEGPGEFMDVAAIGFDADTLVVVDTRSSRITHISLAGALLGTEELVRAGAYPNPEPAGSGLRIMEGGMLMVATSNVSLRTGIGTAVVVTGSDARVLRTWAGSPRIDNGVIGPEDAFGDAVSVALGVDGTIVSGKGRDYCFEIAPPVGALTVVCRERARTPVSSEMRRVYREGLEGPEQFLDAVVDLSRAQTMPDVVPSFDDIRVGSEGLIWVRVAGPTLPDVHPTLVMYEPRAGHRPQVWERFTVEGEPAASVRFPSNFDPIVFGSGEAFGFLESDIGELHLARASWTAR